MYMNHIFMQAFVSGHLRCFQVLAIVSNAALSTGSTNSGRAIISSSYGEVGRNIHIG